MGIVIKTTAFHEGVHIRSQLIGFETGHEATEIIGVRADIACRSART